MCHLEEKWVMNSSGCPNVWFRYVDDTFYLISQQRQRHSYQVSSLPKSTNKFLSFMFQSNALITTPSQHPFTARKLWLDFNKWDSFTPRKYKINLIRTLTYRCLRICSSSSLLQSALNDLKELLSCNGYPRGVITWTMLWRNRNRNKPKDPITTVPKRDVFIVLPYLGLQSKLSQSSLNLVSTSSMVVLT